MITLNLLSHKFNHITSLHTLALCKKSVYSASSCFRIHNMIIEYILGGGQYVQCTYIDIAVDLKIQH